MRLCHFLILIPILFLKCSSNPQIEEHPEFGVYFNEYKVDGSFILFDFNKNTTLIYNKERCGQGFLPASTFKIVNTLIGLETGVIAGIDFVIPWDSVARQIPVWNRDHNLQSAFQNSVVPWYQEMARRVGYENMQHWVSRTDFGKMDIDEKNNEYNLTLSIPV